jgi:lipoprotein-releasing system permease protein
MSLILKIAFRYLKSKKTHSAVNIISIISVCGVAVTTAALICVLSVFNGFSGLIGSKLAKLDPQIKIAPAVGKTISNADSVVKAVSAIDGVQIALPTVEDHALAMFGDYQMPIRLKGVPADYDSVTGLRKVIVDGDYTLSDSVTKNATLSVGVAMQLHARPDNLTMLRIYAPQRIGKVNLANPIGAFRADSMFVGGVYQVEQGEYDKDMVFVPISVARDLFDYDSEASFVEVRLVAGVDEAIVLQNIKSALGNSYTVKNRLMQQSEAFRLVNVEKWVTFLLLGFILIIATFNVISTLSLLIIEKDESIRTFRCLGATKKQITRIFVTEGWLISLTGAVFGIILGLILCWVQQTYGLITLQGDTSTMIVRAYPVQIIFSDILVVFALVAAVGLLTSFVTSFLMRHRLNVTA